MDVDQLALPEMPAELAVAGAAPTLLKIGHLPDDDDLCALLRTIAGNIQAVMRVNGISRRIVDRSGAPSNVRPPLRGIPIWRSSSRRRASPSARIS